MTNKEKYNKVFIDNFLVEETALNENFVYSSIAAWDSIGHMSMIAGLEEQFDIMLETEDIIAFSSYTIGIGIMAKYNIVI